VKFQQIDWIGMMFAAAAILFFVGGILFLVVAIQYLVAGGVK